MFAGSKSLVIAAVVLFVGSILFYTIQSTARHAEESTTQQIQLETLKEAQEIRKKVDNAIEETRTSNPTADPNLALERLRQRQSSDTRP